MMERGKAAKSALLLFLLLLFLVNGCATIPFDYPRTPSSALYRPETTLMGNRVQAQALEHQGASGFYFLAAGVDAFMARVLLIDKAEKTLDLQYYIFRPDLTGKFLLDRIIAAAERGVRVRLLLDDWTQTTELDWWLAMIELYPKIEVRVFNPFGSLRTLAFRPLQAVFGPARLQKRMHNKAFIADNSVAIVGGRNIGDEYFGASTDVNFRDIDIMALGPAARQVSAVFDDYWNCVLSVPLKALVSHRPSGEDLVSVRRDLELERVSLKNSTYGVKMEESDLLKQLEAGRLPFVWAPAEVLFDDPLKAIHPDDSHETGKMARQLRTFLEEARSEALIISPYLVPRKAGVRWFRKIRNRGVAVKIITNSWASTDVPVAHFGYMRYRKDLLRMGVELYELRPLSERRRGEDRHRDEDHIGYGSSSQGALHTKILILDRQSVFVGSFNLDPRSAKLDTQNGIIIRSPELAEQAADLFAKRSSLTRSYRVALTEGGGLVWTTEEDGQEVRYYREPVSGFKRLVLARFLSLFTPESML